RYDDTPTRRASPPRRSSDLQAPVCIQVEHAVTRGPEQRRVLEPVVARGEAPGQFRAPALAVVSEAQGGARRVDRFQRRVRGAILDRKSTRLNSSHVKNSYAV